MAYAKPTNGNVGGSPTFDFTAATGSNYAEPSNKTAGFVTDDPLPARWLNWVWRLVSLWLRFWDERTADGASALDFIIKAPATTGTNQTGGVLDVRGGVSTGTGTSQVLVKACTPGSSGAGANTPATFLTVDGATGETKATKPLNLAQTADPTVLRNGTVWTRNGFLASSDGTLTLGVFQKYFSLWRNNVAGGVTSGSPQVNQYNALPNVLRGGSVFRIRFWFKLTAVSSTGDLQIYPVPNTAATVVAFTNPSLNDTFCVEIEFNHKSSVAAVFAEMHVAMKVTNHTTGETKVAFNISTDPITDDTTAFNPGYGFSATSTLTYTPDIYCETAEVCL